MAGEYSEKISPSELKMVSILFSYGLSLNCTQVAYINDIINDELSFLAIPIA